MNALDPDDKLRSATAEFAQIYSDMRRYKLSPAEQIELDRLLQEAVSRHDVGACRQALNDGADPNAESPEYAGNVDSPLYAWESAPLLRAIAGGFTEGALILIDSGATVTEKDADSTAPLYAAAALNHAEICRALITAGAPTTGGIDHGLPALMMAVVNGCFDACRVLLKHGADANLSNSYGYTPMMFAAQSKHDTSVDILRLLLAAGASTDAPGPDFPQATTFTCFQSAIACDAHRNVAFFLNEVGEGPEQTTADGRTMLELTGNDEINALLRAAVTERSVRKTICLTDELCAEGRCELTPPRTGHPSFGAL